MTRNATKAIVAAVALIGASGSAGAQSTNPTPTCSGTLDIEVHGEHVIADYVTGIGHDSFDWTPSGSEIGGTVSANGGVEIKGGPGPGYHFLEGVDPGASFCTEPQGPQD